MIGRRTEPHVALREISPCQWCQREMVYYDFSTHSTCDRCWQLESRIRNDRELARRMLDAIDKEL